MYVQHILIVDDDETYAKLLYHLLVDAGYAVDSVSSAEDALVMLQSQRIDLVLSEVDLPGMDGLTFCARVRRHSNIPFLFVSNRHRVEDRIAGFHAHADDYIVKPFEPSEIVVRVWARLRRSVETEAYAVHITNDDFDLDLATGRLVVLCTNKVVELTTKEAALLHCLLSHPGLTMTRDALMIKVWGYEYNTENNQLDVYISRLRNKIGEPPSNPRLIRTVRGIGYRYQPGQSSESG